MKGMNLTILLSTPAIAEKVGKTQLFSSELNQLYFALKSTLCHVLTKRKGVGKDSLVLWFGFFV